MKQFILLTGAATLAIATAAVAGPGGDHGNGGNRAAAARGGGGAAVRGDGAAAVRGGGGGHAAVAARVAGPRFAAGGGARAQFQRPAPRAFAARGGGVHFAAQSSQHENRAAVAEHAQAQIHARQAAQMQQRQQMHANQVRQAQAQQHMRAQQAQAQQHMRAQQAQAQQHMRAQQAQAQQQIRAQQAQAQMAQHQQLQANRQLQVQNQMAARQQVQAQRMAAASNHGVGYGVGGCPPGLADKGCMPPGLANHQLAMQNRIAIQQQLEGVGQLPPQQRIATIQSLGPNRFTTWAYAPQTQVLDPVVATDLVGVPVPAASSIVPLGALPQSISYLYPQTPQYYYQYSPGYVYQVDRSTSLIDALIPLLAGGYMPGSYLPSAYMSSYTPDYYGYNSFYPASYGYGGLCNRYAYGVVYQVDCATGMVENEIPTYAGGYGVGQMLPSAYSYYNLPDQYRSLYPQTADTGYWYAPGAIYQYDPSSSLITSVAALMSPGLTVGQPLPAGYDVYNVPYAYRSTYADTANDWYRYNNGYIYQVDPATQLVTAIVASALT